MLNLIKTHESSHKSLCDIFPLSKHKRSPTPPRIEKESPMVQLNMSSDSYRKSSISHWSSIERSKQRQLYFQEERTPFITVAVSSPTDFSGAAIEMHDNRVRTQAKSPSLMEFGPYEDGGVKERRKLPFEVQWSISFRMFRTLENAIFDFTNKWTPDALAMNNFFRGRGRTEFLGAIPRSTCY